VTSEEITDLWYSKKLNGYIKDIARSCTNDETLYKCLVAKAWEMLSLAPRHKTDVYYRRIARGAIKKEYALYKFGEKVLTNL
jgi:hypothetical protein